MLHSSLARLRLLIVRLRCLNPRSLGFILDLKLALQVKNHGILIAVRELDALDAVTPDFVGKF